MWHDVFYFQSLANLLGLTKSEASELLSALAGIQSNQQTTAASKSSTRPVSQLSVTSFLGCFEYASVSNQGKESKDVKPDNTAGPSRVSLPNAVATRKGLSNEMTIQLCELIRLQITGDSVIVFPFLTLSTLMILAVDSMHVTYRKIPVISPRLTQLRKRFGVGLYPGAYNRKNKRFETSHGSVDRNTFFT